MVVTEEIEVVVAAECEVVSVVELEEEEEADVVEVAVLVKGFQKTKMKLMMS